MNIVCISDTHGLHEQIPVPAGDMLLHTGDLTRHGTLDELRATAAWLVSLPHPHKIAIAGNHDRICEEVPEFIASLLAPTLYLCDELIEVNGLRIYGAPWTPGFGGWAFSRSDMARGYYWAQVPDKLDILMTHGPPLGVLDSNRRGEHLGDPLLNAEIARVIPRLHVFGHIHEGYGIVEDEQTTFVNASVCTFEYQPTNPAVVIEFP